MAEKTHYIVRTEDGKCRTIAAQSHRGAMRAFIAEYGADDGEELDVKKRGASDDDWQRFRVK